MVSGILCHIDIITRKCPGVGGEGVLPVCRMLVQLIKLPVHRIHIHVVVFLKVPQEKFNGMVSSQEPLFIQVNFLDLRLRRQKVVRVPGKCLGIVTC